MMLNAQCRYDEALVDYNRVFEIEPGHPKLHFLRAHANKNAGHWCEAIADFEIAALKEPELAQVCNSIVIKMRKLLSEDAESLGITPV
jgi:tetratricopeptide (TPR) repeat protein